ncbi:hypothetical protein ScPMuIL_015653 [Solemya velum]
MSREGGRNGDKHGVPHGETHGSGLNTSISVSALCNGKQGILTSPQDIDTQGTIQDGADQLESDKANESQHNASSIQFLASDTEDFDNYEREVVENNAEWLKSRCRNLGEDFDITATVGEEELGLQNGSKSCISETSVGDDIFGDVNESLVGDSTMEMCTDESGLRQTSVLFEASEDTASTHISIAPLGRGVGTTNPLELIPSDKECLDLGNASELELTLDNKIISMFDGSNLQKELQSLGFKCIDGDGVMNTLMSPQELENLPHGGIEFEESVGPTQEAVNISVQDGVLSVSSVGTGFSDTSKEKDSLLKRNIEIRNQSKSSIATVVSNDSDIKIETSAYIPSSDLKGEQNMKSTPVSSVNSSVSNTSILSSGDLTLATISISTDKASNSTQIVVDTNHGQQMYHINTADLTQATNALEPLSHSQTDATSKSTPGKKTDGSITGYLLLPVAKPVAGNNVLMSIPVNNMLPTDTDTKHPSESDSPSSGSKKVWLCPDPGCGKSFKKLSKLKIHEMRHTGERPFKCSKAGCDWAFTTHYKLKRHEESHEKRKDFICDINGCSRKFTTVYNLNSHKKLHERPCNEVCPEPDCQMKFPTKRQLDIHMKNHAGMEKSYKCPVEGCDKVFYSSNCMGSHARVHQQDKDELTCKFEGCGKLFDRVCRLKQHMRSHTGEKPYPCLYEGCGWAFTTASKLKRHMAKHTGLRKWICNICRKSFMRSEHLKGHMLTHSGAKPFSCPVEGCKARFTAKSSLYVHLKKHDHSGETITYHCPMEGCERKYSTKANLRQHILKHFPASARSDPNQFSQLDLVPLLGGEDLTDATLDCLAQGQGDNSETSGVGVTNSLTSGMLSGQNSVLVDPSEFIATGGGDNALIASVAGDVSSHQLNSALVSQLISGTDLQIIDGQEDRLGTKCLLKPQHKISIAADAADYLTNKVCQESSSGSARTDYRRNLILSDRAKKRRKLLKEKIGEASSNLSFSTNSSDKNLLLSVSPLAYNSSESVTSRGITFRDPETGVLYVQTQLLQDDPPNPELYPEESEQPTLQVTSDSDMGEAVETNIQFTGSTINLEDLE